MANSFHFRFWSSLAIFCLFASGCSSSKSDPAAKQADPVVPSAEEVEQTNSSENLASETPPSEEEESIGPPATYELDPTKLQAAALPVAQLEEGWIRLFDGQSPFGWFFSGEANWRIQDGIISVSRGERSYLCTNFQLPDYEFKVDFRADPDTNSGIFLRTGPRPENVAEDCLELNIAPTDNPFPTGSFVQRKKLEPAELDELMGETFDPRQWHTYHVRLVGSQVTVDLDGKRVMELTDFPSQPTGHISLQHNSGRVEFRNILLRPVNAQTLKLDEQWEDDWSQSVKDGATMDVEVVPESPLGKGGLKLQGGLGQLQSQADFDDFLLQASYTLGTPNVNSGIFFRCIRDNMLDGYECQVNHALLDNDPLRPGDAGAGAIFRRQPARIVMGDGMTPTFITILASGPQILTWVNGVQVADYYDSREPDENPRRGLRTAAGPISLQAHDPTTVVTFHKLNVSEM